MGPNFKFNQLFLVNFTFPIGLIIVKMNIFLNNNTDENYQIKIHWTIGLSATRIVGEYSLK